MHFTILILILALLSSITLSLPLWFNDARDFYHELDYETMQFLLYKMSLDSGAVQRLVQLLADDRFDIQYVYNQNYKYIPVNRINEIFCLVKGRKDLMMYLLGTPYLSKTIVNAMKNSQIWPPTGFPLLVNSFEPYELDTKDTKDILGEALSHPQWWQSSDWVQAVRWSEMDDLRFWRMIPPIHYSNLPDLYRYITRVLLQKIDKPTQERLEELLMKSIRMITFGSGWKKGLKVDGFDESLLLSKFSHLHDPWSIRVLGVLKSIYSSSWKTGLAKILLDFGLFQLSTWKTCLIDTITITNDILELFTVAFNTHTTNDLKERLKQSLRLLFGDMPDWSILRPLLIHKLVGVFGKSCDTIIGKYIDRMLENTAVLSILPNTLLVCSTSLKTHKHIFKSTDSLKRVFVLKAQDPMALLNPYIYRYYQEWTQDKINWSGMTAIREQINEDFKKIFKDGSCDPKTDQEYDYQTWVLLFESIRFDVEHGIPTNTVPSISFLHSLLYYQKNGFINWTELEKIEACAVPKDQIGRIHYWNALIAARTVFFERWPPLPMANAELLQAFIRGDAKRELDELASNVRDISLQYKY